MVGKLYHECEHNYRPTPCNQRAELVITVDEQHRTALSLFATRAEVDAAHVKGKWLAIGVPSLRNILRMSKWKAAWWTLLVLSSFPLHLLWNSVFFETLATNKYVAVLAEDGFLTGEAWSFKGLNATGGMPVNRTVQRLQALASNQSALTRLENTDCTRAYGQQWQKDRRHLIMVASAQSALPPTNSSLLGLYSYPNAGDFVTTYGWMCSPSVYEQDERGDSAGVYACNPEHLHTLAADNASAWAQEATMRSYATVSLCPVSIVECGSQPGNVTVEYCLSEEIPERCSINAVPLYLVIVVICNGVKVFGFACSLYITHEYPPLLTQGDAIQSFLQRPDSTVRSDCLSEKTDFERIWKRSQARRAERRPRVWKGLRRRWLRAERRPRVWKGLRRRWLRAVPCHRRSCIPAIVFLIMCNLSYNPASTANFGENLWSLLPTFGIGQPQVDFQTIETDQGILAAIISSNYPQMLLTYIFLTFETAIGSMVGMAEWTAYAEPKRLAKGLRVTHPKPDTDSALRLHWLFSQMVFFARVDAYDYNGTFDRQNSFTTTFYSPLAMLIAVPLAAIVLLIVIAVGLIGRYPACATLAGCCSASLAAACRPGDGKEVFQAGLELQRVKWGVVETLSDLQGGPGHATVSDGPITALARGGGYE
ncbi:hypothetical protein BAUCODRAFT_144643 [Baudoinia panamericana UAMH 10762]|uniref:DUF6536 domain-containing protein n=1 Tax=Baudoinia panamericana (strain UAMH 10762) TaxID=717646 RepID=M2NA33_BAUPA|nr:uncharacterized protein BAUCODRAFT_144643 [Baudoinia panamericana UAMH 10762]EMD01069.1 hypothetical protein BAUCODRAFT_144643 [Baudoinia panamericana UAMH 10762]